jgi:hypothetical protein
MAKQIIIRGEKRSEPNLRKLARALIALAELEMSRKVTNTSQPTDRSRQASPAEGGGVA